VRRVLRIISALATVARAIAMASITIATVSSSPDPVDGNV